MINLTALMSHPVQYYSPIFREIDNRASIDLKVYYFDDHGVKEKYDEGFGRDIKWDIPLLEGHDYEFLDNWAGHIDRFSRGPINRINPNVISKIWGENHDVLLVMGYDTVSTWLAIVCGKLTSTPVIMRCGSTPSPEQSQIVNTLRKFLFSSLDAVTAVGEENKRFYQIHGISNERIFMSPNTVDNKFWRQKKKSLESKEELRNSYGVDTGKNIYLFVGKLIDIKRPGILIKAFDKATDEGGAKLLFVGDGDMRKNLERRSRMCDRKQDIDFVGFQNQTELPKYYKLSDVFILPSVSETFGMVIPEAMNFSLPIITTTGVGAAADLVDAENGRVVPKDDLEKLAGAISYFENNPGEAGNMGDVSLERVNKWNVERTVDGIVDAAEYV